MQCVAILYIWVIGIAQDPLEKKRKRREKNKRIRVTRIRFQTFHGRVQIQCCRGEVAVFTRGYAQKSQKMFQREVTLVATGSPRKKVLDV